MRIALLTAALAGVALMSAPASGQTAQDHTRAFVDQVSLTSSEVGMARWVARICVGAVGLAPAEAQLLVDRISARAQSVGLRPGEPGCRANVMVIYAPDSDAITRQMVDQRRDLLGYYSDGSAVTPGRAELDSFANMPRPVRWWHVSDAGAGPINNRPGVEMDRQNSGRSLAMAAAANEGTPAGGANTSDMQGMDAVRGSGSRARASGDRVDMSYALVVVDARRVAGVQPGAWMDYVAMVSLAQIDPDANVEGYDTILNVFRTPQSSQTGLTGWDEAYLRGLYRSRTGVGANRQAADIARRMAESTPAN